MHSLRSLSLLALLAIGLTQALSADETVLVDETFEDFARGTLDAGGQNIYVSRDGKLRTINRFDLNGDGHLDLIFNCTHNTYQMLPATVGVVSPDRATRSLDVEVEGSQRVALGDLDGDGFTDAVFCPNGIGVHHDRRFVSVAWGGADGWAARRIGGALPMNAAADVEIVDLNADGRPDIAVLGAPRWRPEQPEGRIIRIYWGSEGGFSIVERQDLGVPGASELAAADFDGDGASDLAVLRADGKIEILWAAPSEIAGMRFEVSLPTADATCLTAADVDGDNRPDLICGTAQDRVYLVPARAERAWEAVLSIPAVSATHVAVGKLDSDDHPDLVLTRFSQARAAGGEQAGAGHDVQDVVRILWGGSEGFDAKRSTSLREQHAVAAAIGDLDADGHADLAVAVHQGRETFGGQSSVYFGDGKRSFTRGDTGFATSGTTHVAVAAAEQGLPARAVFSNSIGGQLDEAVPLHVFWGGRDGFDPERVWKIPFHSGYEASAADLNADGFVDLVALNSGHAGEAAHADPTLGANIFWGGPDGFDLQDRRTVLHEHFLGTSSVADLDRDGFLDLVLEPFAPAEAGQPDMLFIYFGGADGFDRSRRVAFASDGYSQEHQVADFNRDQWLDIAVTTRKFDCVRIFWGGPEGFDPAREQRLKVSGPVGVDAADFDGDGFLDLLAGSYNDPIEGYRDMGSFIFWGSGDGYRHGNAQWLPGFSPLGRTVADFDGDGHLDLFSPQHSGELTREDLACHIYWGSASGFATRRRTTLMCDSVNDSMAGDFNSDGLIDLAVNCHTRHGDHRTLSRVFYNDGHRFQNPRIQKLPTNGPHLMWAVDVGHIDDRRYRQTYESAPCTWEHAARRGLLRYGAEIPQGARLSFLHRSGATLEALAAEPWRPIDQGAFALDRSDRHLQYKAVLESDNGDRYPVLDRVEVTLQR